MPVIYNGKTIRPAPLLTINKEFQKAPDGKPIGSIYRLTLNGQIVAWKGSPRSDGSFWVSGGDPPDETIADTARLKAVQRKQEALLELFSDEGYVLEIQPLDFTTPISCQPRILSVNFDEGIWYETCAYQIQMEADKILGLLNPNGEDSFTEFVQSADESWQLEFADQPESENQPHIFRLTHNLSAVGKRYYDPSLGTGPGSLQKEPWEQARSWVQARLGLDTTRIHASGALNLPSYYQGVNHVRSENVDKTNGSYAVTENWVISSGTATEDFTVETVSGVEDGLVRVNINGTIQGYELRNSSFQITQSKFSSANTKLATSIAAAQSRAQNYGGVTVNPIPLQTTIGKNPAAGTITYSYGYDNRPTNLIPGALSEIITISEEFPHDVFAVLPVLGRTVGPVLQDINTITEYRRTLSIEAILPVMGGSTYVAWSGGKPNVTSIINTVRPGASQVFVESNRETWVPRQGRYTREISWVYQ